MLVLLFLGTRTSEGVLEETSPPGAAGSVAAHRHPCRQRGYVLGPLGLQPHARLQQYMPQGWQIRLHSSWN